MRERERERKKSKGDLNKDTKKERDQSIVGMPIVWARKERDLRDDGADSGGEGVQQMDKMKKISGERRLDEDEKRGEMKKIQNFFAQDPPTAQLAPTVTLKTNNPYRRV